MSTGESKSFASRDFTAYHLLFETHPFERSLENIRAEEVRAQLEAEGCTCESTILEIGVGQTCIAGSFPGSRSVAIDPIEQHLELYLKTCQSRSVEASTFHGTLDAFHQTPRIPSGFDYAVMSSVLHEIPDGIGALRQVRDLLRPGGKVVVVVPNAYSVHRILGHGLGLLDSLESRTPSEITMGQRSAYTSTSLGDDLRMADLQPLSIRTFFIKPLTSQQMEDAESIGILDSATIASLRNLSRLLPDWGAEILAIGVRRE